MKRLLVLCALAGCRRAEPAPPEGYEVKSRPAPNVIEVQPTLPGDPKQLEAQCAAAEGGQPCRDLAMTLLGTDNARAEELWYRLCRADDFVACSDLAYQYDNPSLTLPHMSERAVAVATKACEHHAMPISCVTLSEGYQHGLWGLKKDEQRAKELIVAACKDGHYWSCEQAGLPPPK